MRLLIIFLLLQFISCSNLKKSKEIDCILIDRPTHFLHCGIFSVCVGMKFQKVGSNTLFVGLINCPEFKGEGFFKSGNKYTIIISDEKINKVCEITLNDHKDQKLTTYLVEDVYIK
jgi:hypothetical protein